jgi:hypothetical protein
MRQLGEQHKDALLECNNFKGLSVQKDKEIKSL